ncbi:MAG: hypothetical protein ACP5R5_01050 [Armatimonadota bacterium]
MHTPLRSVLSICALSVCVSASFAVQPGSEAQFYLASSAEHQVPPIRRVRIVAGPIERVSGQPYQWWEMTLEKPNGEVLGVKVLSEKAPLTVPPGKSFGDKRLQYHQAGQGGQPERFSDVGGVARYIFAPCPGKALEYVDELTGAALLPELSTFTQDYFPHASPEARYEDGFATTGRLIGHVLVRTNVRPDLPVLDFRNPTVLRLRSDLRIGSQIDARDDRDASVPLEKREHTPYTREEYLELIAAGANYFHPTPEAVEWIRDLPVYWAAKGTHPDDFYRSNFVPGRMFIDEPATRFGWSKGVPGDIVGPEVIAEAIKTRVEEAERPENRRFDCDNCFATGTMEALYNRYPSWETQQYTAWYQLAGGAPGLVFEGRYVKRGYGWVPESLLGNGLEDLADKQQYDYFHAFLRGAARRWSGYWGTSVYPEGDRSMMIPALTRAYDQGARCLWFWCDRNLPYAWRLQVLKALGEHIRKNPRRSCASASAAIVLPQGYLLAEDTIWGMNREQINSWDVSYSDIAATALFEGILLSRAGIEYDYVNDYDGLRAAGYKQLIYIRDDGRVERFPRRDYQTAPGSLSLDLHPIGNLPTKHEQARYVIPRTGGVRVDGCLDDWSAAQWIEMSGQPYHFGDNYEMQVRLRVPEDAGDKAAGKQASEGTNAPKHIGDYFGFRWDQINEEYRLRYLLEGYGEDQVVITSVEAGGATHKAGLREGDIVLQFGDKRIRWAFELWGMVDRYRKQPNAQVDIRIQRNGVDRLGGPDDLSATFAMMVDDSTLYFAADVVDDLHCQMMRGPEFWKNDCVQLGIAPMPPDLKWPGVSSLSSPASGYGENGHEIGFALADGKAVAWRWTGRRGQPADVVKSARVAIVRNGNHTIYEAAIPVAELAPLAPDMWPRARMCVVVNDSDGGASRKARLELVPGAMTRGKKPSDFILFEFVPSADRKKLSAALFWNRRCMKTGGAAELALAVSSPETRRGAVRCTLRSLDDPEAAPVSAEAPVAVTDKVSGYLLSARTISPPGRYHLEVEIKSPDGRTAAIDSLPVYVYQ